MPIKFVHILAALLLFITACPGNHNSNVPLPNVTEVTYRETSGAVSPDNAWSEAYVVSPAGLTFVRTGYSALTTVNTGTWTINSFGINETKLFNDLSGDAVYGVEKTGQGTPPIGGGIKDYTIHYDNGGTKEVIIGDGSIYNNAGLIATPINNYIANITLPAGASKKYKSVQMGGAIQGNSLDLTATVTTLAGTEGFIGSSDGTGTAALFNQTWGATTDGASLYVVDSGNSTIRKIVISSRLVSTLTGSAGVSGYTDETGTAALFSGPCGITTDGTYLYVADTGNNTIRKIVISSGVVTTLAGMAGPGGSGSTDGTGSSARFWSPIGITTDGTNLYVTDNYNHTIRKIVISSGVVSTLAGTAGTYGSIDGTGTAALFKWPDGITTDGINLYVADRANHTIREIVISTGLVSTLTGSAGVSGSLDGTGTAALFDNPEGITMDGRNLYVADTQNHSIRKIVISSKVVTTVTGSVYDPLGITTDGTNLYVTDGVSYVIRQIQ